MNDYCARESTRTEIPVEAQPKLKEIVQRTAAMQKESLMIVSAISNFLFAFPYDSLPDTDTKCLEAGMLDISRNAELIIGVLHDLAARQGVNG